LLIYTSKTEGAGERLFRVISSLFPERDLEIYQSIGKLTKRLRQPIFYPTIVILLASSKEELQDILFLRDLLENAKIILILPDSNPETLAVGHTLRPRFMSDCGSNFIDLAAVLTLMIRNLDRNKE
jgi:hypothetical protein